jgi:predicted MFS family arabinose efflux permease
MAAALICLLLPLSLGDTWGWGSGATIGLFAAAVILGTAWVRIELRSATPLIDMRVMRRPAVWTANLASLLFGVGLYSAVGYLPSFLQAPASDGYGFGASVTASGLLALPLALGMLLTGMTTGLLARRLPTKVLMVLGAVPPARCSSSSPSPMTTAGRSCSGRPSADSASASRSPRCPLTWWAPSRARTPAAPPE